MGIKRSDILTAPETGKWLTEVLGSIGISDEHADAAVVELVKLRLARIERNTSQDGYELWEQVTKAVCDAFRRPTAAKTIGVVPPEAPEPNKDPPETA